MKLHPLVRATLEGIAVGILALLAAYVTWWSYNDLVEYDRVRRESPSHESC